MKFGENLKLNLTHEWKKQYIDYEKLKGTVEIKASLKTTTKFLPADLFIKDFRITKISATENPWGEVFGFRETRHDINYIM